MLRRLLLALALCLGMLTHLFFSAASPAQAHGKIHCNRVDGSPDPADSNVGIASVDPIVQPGVNPSSHQHEFWANKRLLQLPNQGAGATYNDLVGQATSCLNTADSAAYWAPTLYQRLPDGSWRIIESMRFIAYYRDWDGGDTGTGNGSFPADARIVIGNAKATAAQNINQINWTCSVNSSRPNPYPSAVDAACDTATGTVLLTVRAIGPTCWDGQLNAHTGPGNTADFSGSPGAVVNHFAYQQNGVCPTGFSRKVPRLTVNWWYDYQGSGADLALSSGPRDANGRLIPGRQSQWTMHSDFWNTWVQTGLSSMISRCINTTSAHPHGSSSVCGS